MLSYWERSSLVNYDVIVIGSGIVGLSTAICLKEKNPKLSVAILERGILPTGASTKNAGFACVGSLSEIFDDLVSMTEAEILELVQLRKKGLELLRKRLGDERISYRENGSHELIFEHELALLDEMNKTNTLLHPIFGKDTFSEEKTAVAQFGWSRTGVKTLIKNNAEGEIDTGKMMRALIDCAKSHGIDIFTGCEVDNIKEDSYCNVSIKNSEIIFIAKKIAICTNAFTKSIVPEIDLEPGRGQVLITKSISNLKPKGIFHFEKGYYYFREVDGRILFGGGRNIDFKTENTTSFDVNEKILADLTQKLREIILPDTPFEIDYSWTGIMAFGKNKFPLIRQISSNQFMAVRMGGMGIAIGSKAGEMLAQKIMGNFE
jgi:glycine/D-amino acid oxidase-like deaminating enzyme